MTIKKYQEREEKLDKFLFEKGIVTENLIYTRGAKLIAQAEKIINPPWQNVPKTKPKGSD